MPVVNLFRPIILNRFDKFVIVVVNIVAFVTIALNYRQRENSGSFGRAAVVVFIIAKVATNDIINIIITSI